LTYYLFIYLFIFDVPNRSCVILKYSSVENYFWRKNAIKVWQVRDFEHFMPKWSAF